MDPVTQIVTALAAGAASALAETASSAVKDAYVALKTLVSKRLRGRPDAELVLARHEEAPDTWRAPLMEELNQAEADRDVALVEAAKTLLDLIGQGAPKSKYSIDARGALGVQVGDRNRQENVFNSPPATQQ